MNNESTLKLVCTLQGIFSIIVLGFILHDIYFYQTIFNDKDYKVNIKKAIEKCEKKLEKDYHCMIVYNAKPVTDE